MLFQRTSREDIEAGTDLVETEYLKDLFYDLIETEYLKEKAISIENEFVKETILDSAWDKGLM